jgi:phage tail-like protein
MARAALEDPLKVFRFRVVVDGFVRAGFTELNGIDRNTEEVKYREGGFNETSQKSAGLTEFPDITLKRGQIVGSSRGGDDDYVDWAQLVFDVASAGNDNNYRKDLDIEQYNALNVRARVWRVYNTWPKGYKPMSDGKAEGNENSFEELRLSNEGWEKVL